MYELRRISLMNWNLFELEDIDLFGATALIGAVGVGKSTILDAIQMVLNGNQKSKLLLNRSAGAEMSKRSVLEYCLGHTEETLARGETRSHCDTIAVLTLQDTDLNHSVAIGVVLYAEEGAPREDTRHRFVAPGVDFTFAEYGDRTPEGEVMVASWEEVLRRVTQASGADYMQTTHARAEHFVETYLKVMRPGAASPNAAQFLKRFHNAIAFEEISNPTDFVRKFVLDEDPIDTERLRANLETWDEIDKSIVAVEAKLAAARTHRQRYSRYAVQQFDHLEAEFMIAWHAWRAESIEVEAHEVEIADLKQQISEHKESAETLRTKIDNERAERDRKKDRERESGITEGRALAETRLEMARERRGNQFGELEKLLKAAARIAETRDINQYLPAYAKDAQDAAEELDTYRKALDEDDPVPDEARLRDLARRVVAAAPAKDALEANLQGELEGLASMRAEASDLARRIRQRHETAPVLDPHVSKFMEKLMGYGVSSSALPELVEIREGKESWVRAAEAALGPFREAVFVALKDLATAHQALRTARQNGRQDLWRVRLVNTARIRDGKGTKAAKDDAVVSILETDNDLVRQFLDSQFGHIVMVDTESELRAHSSAILKDGAQSQGLSLRVHEHRDPVLGQAAQAALRHNMMLEHDRLIDKIEAKDRLVRRLKIGGQLFDIFNQFDMAVLAAHLEDMAESHRVIVGLREERDRQVPPEVKALLEEIARHDKVIGKLEEEIDGITASVLPGLERKLSRAEYELEDHGKQKDKAEVELERIRTKDNGDPYVTYRKALRDFEHEAKDRRISRLQSRLEAEARVHAKDPPGAEHHRAEIKKHEAKRSELIANDMNVERYIKQIATFLKEHEEDITIAERAPEDILAWLVAQIFDLEDNVLRRYQGRVREIRDQTREEVREMLVVRLGDKFKRAKEELRNLNKRLKKHRFEGLTYIFTWKVDPEMRSLYKMTQEVSNDPEKAQVLLTEGGSPLLDEAVEQIREIFAGGVDSGKWEDYRQYFTYELNMTHDEIGDDQIEAQDEGDLRGITFTGTLTARAGKGSGGQKQTPYYVAIGASMAAAYYPGVRHDAGRGMGLVCFDEAFSKLDITNTQNLLRFFRDLGLQVLVAAPEEKRTSLMEIMDVVVNISKVPGGTDLYLRRVEVSERAKQALIAANPERKGLEGFRAELDTARQAAE